MKIIFATALYPPETSDVAVYVKELAKRFSDKQEIIIVAYANISEKVKGVKLVTVAKRKLLFLRLIKYAINLFGVSRNADIIYTQNSLAVGLPALIIGFLRNTSVIIRFTEDEAWKRAIQARLTKKRLGEFLDKPDVNNLKIRLIRRAQGFILRRARTVITPSAYLREVLIRAYHLQKERVIVNYNPAKKAEILPFPATKIPQQIIAVVDEKNQAEEIIGAIALLKKEFSNIRLIVAENDLEEKKNKRMRAKILCHRSR